MEEAVFFLLSGTVSYTAACCFQSGWVGTGHLGDDKSARVTPAASEEMPTRRLSRRPRPEGRMRGPLRRSSSFVLDCYWVGSLDFNFL